MNRAIRSSSLQIRDGGTEVDVKDLPVQNQSGHGCHTSLLSFGDAGFVTAQMDDLHLIAGWVQGPGDIVLSSDTDRTTGVVEGSLDFHKSVFSMVDV